MKTNRCIMFMIIAAVIVIFSLNALAQQKRDQFKKRKKPPGQTGQLAKSSGLQPVFADSARCCKIASPFGSSTRYDGSRRPRWAPGGGTHGGVDLTLSGGTSLLALAAGTVVKKGEGSMMEGIYIWLRHAPEDTGLPYWVYSKYQHLDSLPEPAIDSKVSVGQVIAISGKTGTVGGHYGSRGYPHLHLTTRKSLNGEFEGAALVDPLEIYRDAQFSPQDTANGAAHGKKVIIPYVTSDGLIQPKNTRVVWPVACQPK